MAALKVEFRPAGVMPDQQRQIIQFCQTARTANWSLLGSSTTATVYAYNNQWWHSNSNDSKMHITVRYDRRVPNTMRIHIYPDGSVNLNPRDGLRLGGELSDGSLELSDEEGQERLKPVGK